MDINKEVVKSNWVVVFDLDDTLYQEADYNVSGVISVANELEKLFSKNISKELITVRNNDGDIWKEACNLLSLPLSVKESLLWMYRLHCPNIELDKNVASLIKEISVSVKQVVILTDGRSISQRLKLSSLGLLDFPAYISEDFLSNKPEKKRFKLIMENYICDNYIYIADNPEKDFIAPNYLGWRTICLNNKGQNIHNQNKRKLKNFQSPDVWIDCLTELTEHLI